MRHSWILLVLSAAACVAADRPGTAPIEHQPHAGVPAGFAIRHPVDGAEMVWVPAGWFRMGMDKDTAVRQAAQLGYADYHEIAGEESFPERLVHVQGFYIDRCEVTFARWKRFVDAMSWKPTTIPPSWVGPELKSEEAELPIASVTWQAAQEYANWAGKQLPSEAMWEKSARGTDGRWYPWGNELPNRELGVISMTDALPGPQPVGSCPKGASPYGCLDMAGNVYEWTSDWKEPYPNNPEVTGEWGHRWAALRGGSFYHTRHSYRTVKRFGFPADVTYFHVGMRTAWYPPDDFDHQAHAAK
ncbi:MAG: SUMF1/EgtB/PvdO family nonheme iron enzyme [Planctomycetes bacterium]|nr:SUMF1/EgtB/PvdO family nonheme iron enzyme [Planctomycetota bacterium]